MLLQRENSENIDLVVRRDGEKITLDDVPLVPAEYTENGVTTLRYGLNFRWASGGVLSGTGCAFRASVDFVRIVWYGLEDLFTGAAGLSGLSGPIGIVGTMSSVEQSSASTAEAALNLLYLGAFIAVNLAVMNLPPIPALDGGRLFFPILNGILSLFIHRKVPENMKAGSTRQAWPCCWDLW